MDQRDRKKMEQMIRFDRFFVNTLTDIFLIAFLIIVVIKLGIRITDITITYWLKEEHYDKHEY